MPSQNGREVFGKALGYFFDLGDRVGIGNSRKSASPAIHATGPDRW